MRGGGGGGRLGKGKGRLRRGLLRTLFLDGGSAVFLKKVNDDYDDRRVRIRERFEKGRKEEQNQGGGPHAAFGWPRSHQFGHREEGHQKATVRSFAEEGQKGQGAHRRPATASSSFLYNLKNTPRRRARREVADKVPPAEDLKFVPGTRSDETGLDWAARRNPARQKVRTTTCVAICWPGSQAQGTVFSAPPAAKAGRLRLTIKAHQSQLF